MENPQSWDPDRYARNARFVSDLGMPVVELLAPQPGERILDLGCGDGALTAKLVAMGCEVVGVDASEPQIRGARAMGLDAHVMDGEHLTFDGEFDAVFSNAAIEGSSLGGAAVGCLFATAYWLWIRVPPWYPMLSWIRTDGLGMAIVAPACVSLFSSHLRLTGQWRKHWFLIVLIPVTVVSFCQARVPVIFLIYPVVALILFLIVVWLTCSRDAQSDV